MGISFSTTTARRRAPTHPYPPPLPPADYYPSFPFHSPSPYPVHSPSSPPVYYPYFNSDAYGACNHATPVVGQPYFGPPLELQPPSQGEQKPTKIVISDVNVHKDTLRFESDDLNPERCLVSFVFDAMIDGRITIYYFAKEEAGRRVAPLFPETYVPIKVPFRKGLHQEFRQPSGTGIDLRFLGVDDISISTSRHDVFPIVISAETCLAPYIIDARSYLLAHTLPQMQITQVALVKSHEEFTPKVVRQLLWTDDACYELREIYGLGKSGLGFNDNALGKECVVCMTEPKDILLLPCRHMCLCSDCATTLRLQSNKCPICREVIEAVLEIKIDEMDIA